MSWRPPPPPSQQQQPQQQQQQPLPLSIHAMQQPPYPMQQRMQPTPMSAAFASPLQPQQRPPPPPPAAFQYRQNPPLQQQQQQPLPPAWIEYKSQEGKTYWFNKALNKSSWEKPDELKTAEEKAKDSSPWKEYKNSEGKTYYYNAATKVTTWEIPTEYKELLRKIEAATAKPLPPVAPPLSVPTTPISNLNPNTTPVGPKHVPMARPIRPEPVKDIKTVFDTREEAEQAFTDMLKEVGVEASWTWEAAMRVIISHPLYRALKTLDERKSTFYRHVADLKHIAQEEAKAKEIQIRKEFTDALGQLPDIKVTTPYIRAAELLADHPSFLAVTSERERENIFADFIRDMRRHERNELRQRQKILLEQFEQIVRTFPALTFRTKWTEIRAHCEQSPEFQELIKSPEIGWLDLLVHFEEMIKKLERDHQEVEEREMRANARTERKKRDAFRELLGQLKEEGLITPIARWQDIYPRIAEEPAYLTLLGEPGSNPQELFWAMVQILDEELDKTRRIVTDILKYREFKVEIDTPFELVEKIVHDDEPTQSIDPKELKIIFTQLLKKAKRRLESERRRAESRERRSERKLRKRMDNFSYLLKRVSPPITPQDDWESVFPRVKNRSDYLALQDEEVARECFAKYIESLEKNPEDDADGATDVDMDVTNEREDEKSSRGRDRSRRRSSRKGHRHGRSESHESAEEPAPKSPKATERRARSRSASAEEGEIESEHETRRSPAPSSNSSSRRHHHHQQQQHQYPDHQQPHNHHNHHPRHGSYSLHSGSAVGGLTGAASASSAAGAPLSSSATGSSGRRRSYRNYE